MNEETRIATLGSIKKWKEIEVGTGTDEGIFNCPLCKMFRKEQVSFLTSCGNCPVKVKTGENGCEASPYDAWVNHMEEEHELEDDNEVHCPTCKELATEERKFLESLLEE